MDQFSGAYLRGKDEPNASFYSQLYQATEWVLQPENPDFVKLRKELATVLHLKGDSLLVRIGDSIYQSLSQEVYWKDQQVDIMRFQKILVLGTNELCACINSKLEAGHQNEKIWEIVSNCDTSLSQNAPYIAQIREEAKKFGLNDLRRAQLMVVKFLYTNCSSFRNSINSMLAVKLIDNCNSYTEMVALDLEEKIVRFYKNKRDSLATLFPDHANYKSDIETAMSYVTKTTGSISRLGHDPSTDQFTRTRTYYVAGKPSTIIGQTVCEYEQDGTSIKVIAFRFISPDKITNKAELLSDIDVQVPPPYLPVRKANPAKKGNN